MRVPNLGFDYTARDYDDIKRFLVSWLKSRRPNDFSDFTESQLGIVILELWAAVGELMSYSLDRASNEVFMSTARQRDSVIRHAALMGYKLAPATSASCTLFLDVQTLLRYTSTITIAKGQKIAASDVSFETLIDYVIDRTNVAGTPLWSVNGDPASPAPVISASEGKTVSTSFTSIGGALQVYVPGQGPYVLSTMVVTVAGQQWTAVDSLVIGRVSDPSDRNIYEITLDKDDAPTIRFGDGTIGGSPVEGDTIAITYRVGGGSLGNVAAGVMTGPLNASVNGTTIRIPVYNDRASGGTDREDIERAKLFAPYWARTTDRVVTFRDYHTVSNGYYDTSHGYVAKAGVVADPTDGLSNAVTVYVWAEDTGRNLIPASAGLKTSLRNYLDARRTLSVYLNEIQDGENVPLTVDLLVRVRPDYVRSDVNAALEAVIRDHFLSAPVRFGNELFVSDLFAAVSTTSGVDWAHIEAIRVGIGADLKQTATGLIEDIQAGTLSATQPAGLDQVRIPATAGTVVDFYANYRIRIGTQARRIISSTVEAGGTVDLTIESQFSPTHSAGQAFSIVHPRRVKVGIPADLPTFASLPLTNRIMVLPSSLTGDIEQTRGIIAFDSATRIATVDKDWPRGSYPTAGTEYSITRDYRSPQNRALVLSTVRITNAR